MNKQPKLYSPAIATPRPQKYRVMQTGSRGHGKTFKAMAAYHKAKKAGQTCLIVAKNEQEKMRLIQNHYVDPGDIQVANPDAQRGQSWN